MGELLARSSPTPHCKVQSAELRMPVGERLGAPENERTPPNNQLACHSERRKTLAFCEVELPRVEPWRTSGSKAPKRRRDLVTTFGDLSTGCYIDSKSHPNSLGDPASPYGSRFFLAIRSEKVRQAQDDIQRDYSVVYIRKEIADGYLFHSLNSEHKKLNKK